MLKDLNKSILDFGILILVLLTVLIIIIGINHLFTHVFKQSLNNTDQNIIDVQHKIAIIDQCEYVLIGNKSVWIHKGNCNNPVHQKEIK